MAAPRKSLTDEEAKLLAFLLGDESDEDEFDQDEFYLDDEDDEWPRPEWLHADCVNPCLALDLGTCCKDPANPVARRAVELADAVDRVLGRPDNGECVRDAPELARLLELVPALLAQVHAILPGMDATAVAQLLCPVGRLAVALDQDRRAEFEPLRPLLGECSAALWARAGGPGRLGSIGMG